MKNDLIGNILDTVARAAEMAEWKCNVNRDLSMIIFTAEIPGNEDYEFLIAYGQAYKEAGAHGIMMAEPVAGLLSPSLEEEFSAPYVKKIVDALQDDSFIIVYHNCGDNVLSMMDSILSIGAGAYHFGNAIDMETVMQKIPSDVIAMGNVDPAGVLCCGTPESVRKATTELLEKCSKYPNFIVSSGCDIPPHTPWANIEAFFETVNEFYNR
jgi:uroporphyrinogen decarboxylase